LAADFLSQFLIMVISFLPVFALTGQSGKLFHPLAFTKTFALIGTAIFQLPLVPRSFRFSYAAGFHVKKITGSFEVS